MNEYRLNRNDIVKMPTRPDLGLGLVLVGEYGDAVLVKFLGDKDPNRNRRVLPTQLELVERAAERRRKHERV